MSEPTPPPEQDRPTTSVEDELVSAVLDGEATAAERAVVDADPRLRARLEVFARVQASTAADTAPAADAADDAIARALGAADIGRADETDPTPLALARERRRRRVAAVLAAAAVLVIVVPLLAITLLAGGREEDVASSGSADDRGQAAQESQASDAAAPMAGGQAPPVTASALPADRTLADAGDLGAVQSIAELRAEVLAVLATTGGAPAQDASSTTTAPAAPALSLSSCPAAVAAADPSLGSPVLTATATLVSQPVVVVVYGAGNGVLVVMRPDCTVLEQSRL